MTDQQYLPPQQNPPAYLVPPKPSASDQLFAGMPQQPYQAQQPQFQQPYQQPPLQQGGMLPQFDNSSVYPTPAPEQAYPPYLYPYGTQQGNQNTYHAQQQYQPQNNQNPYLQQQPQQWHQGSNQKPLTNSFAAYLTLGIISVLFCGGVFAIPSFVYAVMMNTAYKQGNGALYLRRRKTSLVWLIVAFCLGLAANVYLFATAFSGSTSFLY